jgi:hypothetical protein
MSVSSAWRDGWRRTLAAPYLVAGVWLATLAVALPLAFVLRSALAAHLGSSLAAEEAAARVNGDWWNEFLAQSSGLGQTFVPGITGFSAILKNWSAVADALPIPGLVTIAIAANLALAIFLVGGTIDRLARDRRVGSHGFLMACGMHFPRLLRLAVIAGLCYWALFAWLHVWLFDSVYPTLTRDVTVERTAFFFRAALYAAFAVPLLVINLVVDYAKVRMVVEDRRSAIGAVAASVRFIARQPVAAVGLYLLNTAAFLALVVLYAAAAPSLGHGASNWTVLLVGQLFIVGRAAVRLAFAASEVALFQSRLAHVGYTAAPLPAWPDSPAAEAILPQ